MSGETCGTCEQWFRHNRRWQEYFGADTGTCLACQRLNPRTDAQICDAERLRREEARNGNDKR